MNLNNRLNLNYSENTGLWLTQQNTLRKLVGVLGMLMPLLLYLMLRMDNGHSSPLESISHYYFTRVSSVFIIIVSLLAFFLLIYQGERPADFYFSSFAGIFALALLLFPTDNLSAICNDSNFLYSITILPSTDWSESRVKFHYFSAATFLTCLAIMSLFLFTEKNAPGSQTTTRFKVRNLIFILCGLIMTGGLLVVLAGYTGLIPEDIYKSAKLTFWMEVVAIEAFGISWLVKGTEYFNRIPIKK